MNIKSLLLGSAAAMVAVSGAQAADAVVVEPEPVEYVRVCDAYGSGFFFIPGTETCLRIGGFMRVAYNKAHVEATDAATGAAAVDADGNNIGDADATQWRGRARINLDTRNETELGTLRALIRLEAGNDNELAGTAFRADVGLISLAGFRLGQNGGNYWTSNHGFAGVNLEGAGGPGITTDGWYGFQDSIVFDYTWAADGFAITVGVEDVRAGGVADLNGTFNGNDRVNYYAGINYSADFGTLAFTAAHDSDAAEIDATGAALAADGEWAYKVSLSLDLAEFVPGGILHGFYMNDGDARTEYVFSDVHDNAETVWGIAFQANVTDEVEFVAQYHNADGGNALTAGGVAGGPEGDADLLTVGLNWYPTSTPGFHVKTAYFTGSADNVYSGVAANPFVDLDYDGFEISVRRDF